VTARPAAGENVADNFRVKGEHVCAVDEQKKKTTWEKKKKGMVLLERFLKKRERKMTRVRPGGGEIFQKKEGRAE